MNKQTIAKATEKYFNPQVKIEIQDETTNNYTQQDTQTILKLLQEIRKQLTQGDKKWKKQIQMEPTQ